MLKHCGSLVDSAKTDRSVAKSRSGISRHLSSRRCFVGGESTRPIEKASSIISFKAGISTWVVSGYDHHNPLAKIQMHNGCRQKKYHESFAMLSTWLSLQHHHRGANLCSSGYSQVDVESRFFKAPARLPRSSLLNARCEFSSRNFHRSRWLRCCEQVGQNDTYAVFQRLRHSGHIYYKMDYDKAYE